MVDTVRVCLPGGLWTEGGRERSASLRSLTGHDELFLAEHRQDLSVAEIVTAILCRCVTGLGARGDEGGASPEDVRRLTVGDREALLIELRRLTLGDRLACVIRCPDAGCGERLDVDLSLDDFLLAPYEQCQELYEATFETAEGALRVGFRIPNGGDQESVVALARSDARAAGVALIARCIESLRRESNLEEVPFDALSPELGDKISLAMSRLDPQAEIVLNLECAGCGNAFSTMFDTASFLLREIGNDVDELFREVHQLALHYHWNEPDILALSAKRRRRYLSLLAETMRAEAGR